MCATPDRKALRERRSRTSTLRGWKVLMRGFNTATLYALFNHAYIYTTGMNCVTRSTGKPLKSGEYQQDRPRGLHVYRRRRDATLCCYRGTRRRLVPVTYQPRDVIAAENLKESDPQVVVRKLRISQRAYDAAMEA